MTTDLEARVNQLEKNESEASAERRFVRDTLSEIKRAVTKMSTVIQEFARSDERFKHAVQVQEDEATRREKYDEQLRRQIETEIEDRKMSTARIWTKIGQLQEASEANAIARARLTSLSAWVDRIVSGLVVGIVVWWVTK